MSLNLLRRSSQVPAQGCGLATLGKHVSFLDRTTLTWLRQIFLLGCIAVPGISGTVVDARAPGSPALSTMHQCFFQPDGFFYLKGSPTEGFEEFDHLALLTLAKGVRRPPTDSRLYTRDGKSYQFTKFSAFNTHASKWGLTFEFETEMLEGVSYRFTGKFSSICFFAEDERDPKKAVAEGRLAKFRENKEAAKADVQFTYAPERNEALRYPRAAGDIIAFVEAFSQVDLSVNDAIKNLDTNPAPGDREQAHILLRPFPSDQTMIRKAVLDVFKSKPDRVNIEYREPILIAYGALKEEYGSPKFLQPPVVGRCSKPRADCQPAFVGYSFSFRNLTSNKRLEVAIDLRMNSSKIVPQHTDKDFLAVKEIRIRRIWRDRKN